MGVRAIGAFSGGLDGMIASLMLLDQGVEVEAVIFDSPFFSCRQGQLSAEQIGVKWRSIDFTEDILEIISDPPSGFGGNCNPCIDCHARMFERVFRICNAEGFDFIFSGEVLGQRPMSQNRGALNRVARLSGAGKLLLRPLSARLLTPTGPEVEGLVDRENLGDISGRGRKRQIELAGEYGITYANPAGGCLLTDPGYSVRLKVLLDQPVLLTPVNTRLIRHGRMFLLDTGVIGLVGRSKEDNDEIEALSKSSMTFTLSDRPGPTGVIIGRFEESHAALLGSLLALYSKIDADEEAAISSSSGLRFTVAPADREQASKMRITL
jgi:tRNA U34 2-thiouridine synthase MnmA/TrmU